MIIIIDIGEPGGDSFSYTRFKKDGTQIVLDGTFHVIGRFEVLGTDEDGEPNVIRDLPPDWRPDDRIPPPDLTVPPEGP